MIDAVAALCAHRPFHHFHQICQIPHGSGDEGRLSDFLLSWARDLGMEARQDEAGNVFVRAGASPGCHDAPPVMLQAHMDMVCEKAAGVEHDFRRDPIPWSIDGDLLSTGGRTTLGADDGIGIALILSVLEDRALRHPPLEALFTVMEEEDLSGALRFDTSQMTARRIINLDHVRDDEILCGSCGGMRTDLRIPVLPEAPPDGWTACRLRVSGLRGGHSGEDIHRGRGNANEILVRALMALERRCPYALGEIRGGSFRLAIPRDAEAVLWLAPSDLDAVREEVSTAEARMRAELSADDPLRIALDPTVAERWCVRPTRVIDALALVPDGIGRMSGTFPGTVDTSDNLGEVRLDRDALHMTLELRSASESGRTDLFRRMERLAALLGGTCQASDAYPGWAFRPVSPLRDACIGVYRELYGTAPRLRMVHAGLEVGCLFRYRPDLDAVSIGPNCRDFHSPSETLEISSVGRTYRYLRAVLDALCQTRGREERSSDIHG